MSVDDTDEDIWSDDAIAARTQAFTELLKVVEVLEDESVKDEALLMLRAVRATIEPVKSTVLATVTKLHEKFHTP